MFDNIGIYEIVNKINGHRYIGSSTNLRVRKYNHLRDLRKNKHHSPYLQHSWNQHGENAFEFNIILNCDKKRLLYYEQILLDWCQHDYNVYITAGSPLGIIHGPHSEEWNNKISEGNKGKVLGESQRTAIADANRRRIISEETRAKMRKSHTGSNNHFFGKHHTAESKQKIRDTKASQKGLMNV